MSPTFLLQHLLSHSAVKFPEKPAVVCNGLTMSYNELDLNANKCAFFLQNSGVQENDRVGILLEKSFESIISLFGILRAGAIYVPLDVTAPPNRIERIINNCGIHTLIASAKALEKIISEKFALSILKQVVHVSGVNLGEFKGSWDLHSWDAVLAVTPDIGGRCIPDISPAYILHTSGSTGIPKGVVISHRNALSFVEMAVEYFGIHSDDRLCNYAPLHFDLSVFDLFASIKVGATVIMVPEYFSAFPVKLAEYIDKERISVWNSVSPTLAMLAERGRLDRFKFESLRLVHFSGDIMPAKLLRILQKNMGHAALYNIYGQTEANSSLCYRVKDISADDTWKIPIGKPFPNFEVFALNENNALVMAPGEEGELYVNSATVAIGYWNDETKTLQKFVVDPRNRHWNSRIYKTGDIVRLDHEGNFVFIGRKDHLIKSKGYRIELGEIETVLGNHPAICQAVAFGIHDELIGKRIKVVITPTDDAIIEDKDIFNYCARMLPHYMVPESIARCVKMPLTASGKIDRKALEKMFGETI